MCSIFIFTVAFSILNLSVSVYANQPIVRFKNRTVGILADADAGVFTATENVTILGDLEVKATNKKVNITEKVDSLIRLQSNMELRVNGFVHHANMGVVCDPEGTEYRSRNFETARNWIDSIAYCESLQGGYAIASIHSQEEQNAVTLLMNSITKPVLYGWVVAYLGAITQGDGNWYWYDGTPWDFVNSVRDGMGGTSETRLAVTDEEGGKWHDWGTGDTTLGVICRLVGE
ncbi:unnamed protein product [Bathycoccus prasinos]